MTRVGVVTRARSRGASAQNARLARIGVECDPLETVMHRMALFAIAVLLLLVAAEIRLSRGDNNYSEPPPPDLWEHAQPPGRWSPPPVVVRAARGTSITYPDPSSNCALIVSTNPRSSYTLTSADAFPYTANPIKPVHDQTLLRGKRATFAHHDPRPCLIPPDWSGGYTSIFSLQQMEDERASSGGGVLM